MDDLCHLPARRLSRLMTSGEVSCREVVQAHLVQIGRVNPVLNALVQAADPERCLQLADHADTAVAQGRSLGAAHGLITGWPAAVVRRGTSADGVPIGVQVSARPWQDATALAV